MLSYILEVTAFLATTVHRLHIHDDSGKHLTYDSCVEFSSSKVEQSL